MTKIKGSLHTKTGGKNYYAVLSGYDENGKRKQQWLNTGVVVKGNNKRKAEDRLREILAEYNDEDIDIGKDANFIDFYSQWLETMKVSVAPTTHDGYIYILQSHIQPHFGKKRLKVRDVTPTVIQNYVNGKLADGLSSNTVRRHLANLSKCLDNAIKQGILTNNPVKRIEMPKKERFTGAKYYNEEQIERLLEVPKGDPLEIVILLTLFYGLRRSETLGLRYEAVDFGAKTLAIKHTVVRLGKNTHIQDRTKNDSSYAVFPMPDKIISQLKRWKAQQEEFRALQPNDYVDSGYVCTKPNGELLSPCYVSRHFALLLKKNSLPPIRFHDLRHSSASFLKSLGFDLKDIQTWLRHSSIVVTMNTYTHLDMQAKSNIADTLSGKLQAIEI